MDSRENIEIEVCKGAKEIQILEEDLVLYFRQFGEIK